MNFVFYIIISSSFELLFDRYCKIPNLSKSVDVVLIKHNDNTGSSSIFTKDESCPSSSINDESGESLVDTTLSILKMLLLDQAPSTLADIDFNFYLFPSDLANPIGVSFIGNGRLFISDRAQFVFDYHQLVNGINEVKANISTTNKGIGPAYSSKASRSGLRPEFERRFHFKIINKMKRFGEFEYNLYVVESVNIINTKILVEGTTSLILDINFGTYPYVTFSNTSIGGVSCGFGISPKRIDNIYGVDEDGNKLQSISAEFGTITGRRRRCGCLDAVVLKYSVNIIMLDVLDTFETIKIGMNYIYEGKKLESLPPDLDVLEKIEDRNKISQKNVKKYVEMIEEIMGIPVEYVCVGIGRNSIIKKIF
ncbi:Adenylosuccinate synthetase [Neocallimastix lanati (nom. inval.)]|nr:Adenylosuccinate synthetase [Neocallimastix sp. JGI-2020a]